MRTIRMTLDDDIVEDVDMVAREMGTNRSAFTQATLREAVRQFRESQLELKHRQGYEKHPVNADEFTVWESERNWGEERIE